MGDCGIPGPASWRRPRRPGQRGGNEAVRRFPLSGGAGNRRCSLARPLPGSWHGDAPARAVTDKGECGHTFWTHGYRRGTELAPRIGPEPSQLSGSSNVFTRPTKMPAWYRGGIRGMWGGGVCFHFLNRRHSLGFLEQTAEPKEADCCRPCQSTGTSTLASHTCNKCCFQVRLFSLT